MLLAIACSERPIPAPPTGLTGQELTVVLVEGERELIQSKVLVSLRAFRVSSALISGA